ncbi:hypothetical protein GCM10009039_07570 [Halocalculus aciditolerans]|uniref:Uncharacterized protein n=1 Tax=Halocalculus aciditolerans TaxID=1383812 RepID=A0A830FG19_9EURY|nr:hypothetical protein GCM10009039_07570 [Halocalculus aciditolerans]
MTVRSYFELLEAGDADGVLAVETDEPDRAAAFDTPQSKHLGGGMTRARSATAY